MQNSYSELSKNGATKCHSVSPFRGQTLMSKRLECGFSLIELLIVVVIIGILAALSIPVFQKAKRSAENGTTFGTMRAVASTEISFFSQNNRFARLTELQDI